jgi:SAM-dependent methyltransferase
MNGYQGHRILEAMRSAPRYADAVFRQICSVVPPTGSVLLDFGAGDGVFFEKFVVEGYRVDCVEPDIVLQRSLSTLGGQVYPDIFSVPSSSYDFVYSVNVIEHITVLDKTLVEVRRVMRPGASIFVFVPAFNLLWTSLDDEVGHVQRFTRKTLNRALSLAGFESIQFRYFDSLGFPAALTVRFLEKIGLFRYSSKSVGLYDRYVFPVSRAVDRVASGLIGKNLIAVARVICAES